MDSYGTLDSLLEYSLPQSYYFKVQQASEKDDPTNSLETFLQEKVRCLSDILNDIGADIDARRKLSQTLIDDIQRVYCYLKTKLFQLYSWTFGASRSIESRRSGLERQLDTLNEERRQEQIEFWKDVAQLRKEFRIWFKQYSDLAQRVRIILPGEKQAKFGGTKNEPKRITGRFEEMDF